MRRTESKRSRKVVGAHCLDEGSTQLGYKRVKLGDSDREPRRGWSCVPDHETCGRGKAAARPLLAVPLHPGTREVALDVRPTTSRSTPRHLHSLRRNGGGRTAARWPKGRVEIVPVAVVVLLVLAGLYVAPMSS